MAIFKRSDEILHKEQNIFQMIFRRLPKENFIIDLEGILSEHESDFTTLKSEDFSALCKKYHLGPKSRLKEREELFNRALVDYSLDARISDKERANLTALKNFLNLSDDYYNGALKAAGEAVLKEKIEAVISDDVTTDEEAASLGATVRDFGLDKEASAALYDKECKKKIQALLDEIAKKRRFSPDDEKKLRSIVTDLKLSNITLNEKSQAAIKKFKALWAAENAPLTPLLPPINGQRGEEFYYTTHVEWDEERRRQVYTTYSGLALSYRICRGVTLRSGAIAPSRHSEEYLSKIDEGDLFLTNKRVIFIGAKGNKTILYKHILTITPYSDCVCVGKDAGRPPYLLSDNPEILSALLLRLISSAL